MANLEYKRILKQSVKDFNQWRKKNPDIKPNLRLADLSGTDLQGADLSKANLRGVDLSGANLRGAKLSRADFSKVYHTAAEFSGVSPRKRTLIKAANLRGTDLQGADLSGANLRYADLSGANLSGANLRGSKLSRANLSKANLSGADLTVADLIMAYLIEANLSGAILTEVSLMKADLSRANLSKADLSWSNLTWADLSEAILYETDLSRTALIETKLHGTNLIHSRVYGISAWDLILDNTTQTGLIITKFEDPVVTVDDIEVAQFIYLLMANQKIRNVIHTVTSKAVLVLGRFTDDRKPILNWLHDVLKDKHNLVPILFDFKPSKNRDLTETIQLLANMCRFVVADVTDAKSIPQELSAIIPHLLSVPIQPLILSSQRPYAMFEHWRRFDNVLSEHEYNDLEHLKETLREGVLTPIENWEKATDKAKAQEQALRERIQQKDDEIARLRARLEAKD